MVAGARRFKDLGVAPTKTIEQLDVLDLELRRVTSEDLTPAQAGLDLDAEDLAEGMQLGARE